MDGQGGQKCPSDQKLKPVGLCPRDTVAFKPTNASPTLIQKVCVSFFVDGPQASSPPPRPKTFLFLGVAGGTIERSCYSPHYVNTERDYERDYQATLPQGRTAADGCKPRHGRDDRKRERSFSGLSLVLTDIFRGRPGRRPGDKRSPAPD